MRHFVSKVRRNKYRVGAVAVLVLATVMGCYFLDEHDESSATGTVPWPEWSFHHWVWYGESTQDSAISLVQEYIDHDIPVGAIIIDSPWETGYNTFDWDLSLYPEPQAMIDWFHDNDVRVVMWITSTINAFCANGDTIDCPEYDVYQEGLANEYFMGYDTLVPWWKCPSNADDFCGGLIDYFNPEAVEWWHGLMDKVLDMGIDGWKCDGTDPYALLAPISPYAGTTHPWDYTELYYRDFFEYSRERLGPDRVIMARTIDSAIDLSDFGFPGVDLFVPFAPRDTNFAGWVGDQAPTWDGMHIAMTHVYYSALAGYVIFGSDNGGYKGGYEPEQEIFLRWTQWSAVCPLMENGGNSEHRPWLIGDTEQERKQTEDIYRLFVNLHYKLIPYMQEQAAKAWAEGGSFMKMLKNDGEVWTWQYLFGDDMLVAPFYQSGNFRTVSFPEGDDWVYLFERNLVFKGGSTAKLWVPITESPIFLQES
jgi:alpha-glucosidase (family GH31 glycosyl hydrolase)